MVIEQLSKNFKSSEIFGRSWEGVPERTKYARFLCTYILQPVRDLKPDLIIDITSGYRDSETVRRLRTLGYNPSVTTDHYFGKPQTIPHLPSNARKIDYYGSVYTFSVGAVDMVPRIPQKEKDFREYFEWLVRLDNAGIIDAGQIILEKGKHSYWIHISNPKSLVYQDDFIQKAILPSTKYMLSLNNGKTYIKYNP